MPFGVVSGVGLGRGVLDFGGDRRRRRGSHVLAAAHGRRAQSVQLGHDLDFTVNLLGLCDDSNLLFFLSAEERRAFLK